MPGIELDAEVVAAFEDASALLAGGLRHLRPGQRLTVVLDGETVTELRLGSITPPTGA